MGCVRDLFARIRPMLRIEGLSARLLGAGDATDLGLMPCPAGWTLDGHHPAPTHAPEWRLLADCRDPRLPKLHNLGLAARAGIAVPSTYWIDADSLDGAGPLEFPALAGLTLPCIVRSASPSEDTADSSNAGRFLSVVVRRRSDFPRAVRRVLSSLADGHDPLPIRGPQRRHSRSRADECLD